MIKERDTFFLPFSGEYIVFRPLHRLAFVGNRALMEYLRRRERKSVDRDPAVEAHLAAIGYERPILPAPADWRPKKPHRPTTAVLMLTGACNLRCLYCYADAGGADYRAMSPELARSVIQAAWRNAKAAGTGSFTLSFHGGGEPTLNSAVMQGAVAYARSLDLPCHITAATNGVMSDAMRRFLAANMDSVSLSCDGAPAVQSAQRPTADGRDSSAAVLETVRALEEARVSYGIRLTVTQAWTDSLPDSIAFLGEATRSPVFQVELTFTGARGRYAEPTPRQGKRFVDAFLRARETAARIGRTLTYSGARPEVVTAAFCQAPGTALVCTPEGKLVTCFEVHDPALPHADDFVIGSASPEDGVRVDFARLWRFAEMQRVRRKRCRGCFCYWSCAGDCATRCLAKPRHGSVRCSVNRAITREILALGIQAGGGCWHGEPSILPERGMNTLTNQL